MSRRFGPVLLAAVGLVLVVGGLALVALAVVDRTSGLVALPGLAVLGIGIRLVLLSAYFEDVDGEATRMGVSFRFRHRHRSRP